MTSSPLPAASSRRAAQPYIAFAGHFQFAPRQLLGPRTVQSRMFLWVQHGSGSVTVDGQRYALTADNWLFLPWMHRITYQADTQAPMAIGTIHLIPDGTDALSSPAGTQPADKRPAPADIAGTGGWRVHHSDLDTGPVWADRSDAPLAGIPATCCVGDFINDGSLFHLASYVLHHSMHQTPHPAERQALAQIFLAALANTIGASGTQRYPPSLRRALTFCRSQHDTLPTVSAIAQVAGVSPPTLTRLFRAHLGYAPKQWLLRQRLDHGRRLLLTTSQPIHHIARQCGFHDPLYFSKLCRKLFNATPTSIRTSARW